MTPKDLSNLKVEVTKDLLRSLISKVVITQERIMTLNKQYEEALKKKKGDRSEEEKMLIEEHEANLKTFKEGLEQSRMHIDNYCSLIDAYTDNRPIEL